MSMHPGATLKLLRLERGLSLRDLASRLGVSSAYLSRVENGVDACPTPPRLSAIARELEVPEQLLLDATQAVSPYVLRYAEAEPQAASLFLEIARRGLGPAGLAELQAFINERFAPLRSGAALPQDVSLAPQLAPGRLLLGFAGGGFAEALELAAGRFDPGGSELGPARFAAAFRQPVTALGRSLAVAHAALPGVAEQASLVTMEPAPPEPGPDGLPVSVLVLLISARPGPQALARITHVARLASRGLALELAQVHQPAEALARIAALEAVR